LLTLEEQRILYSWGKQKARQSSRLMKDALAASDLVDGVL
jgi:hypothetical protein